MKAFRCLADFFRKGIKFRIILIATTYYQAEFSDISISDLHFFPLRTGRCRCIPMKIDNILCSRILLHQSLDSLPGTPI